MIGWAPCCGPLFLLNDRYELRQKMGYKLAYDELEPKDQAL